MMLRILITTCDGWLIARGIEHDICAQARKLDDLKYELERVIATHVSLDIEEGRAPLSLVPQAPADVEAKWTKAWSLVAPSPAAFEGVPQFEMRVASA